METTYLTVSEAAQSLGISASAVRAAIRTGRLRGEVKYGRKIVAVGDVESYRLRAHPEGVKKNGRPRTSSPIRTAHANAAEDWHNDPDWDQPAPEEERQRLLLERFSAPYREVRQRLARERGKTDAELTDDSKGWTYDPKWDELPPEEERHKFEHNLSETYEALLYGRTDFE